MRRRFLIPLALAIGSAGSAGQAAVGFTPLVSAPGSAAAPGLGGDLQADAAERADPHGRGDPEAIGGWYPAHAATADTTITIVRGKSQAVGTAGSQERSGPVNGDTPISSVRGHRDPGDGSSSASSHSGGHGRQSQARPNHTTAEQPHRRHEGEQA
jgi:hypothetical protein